MIQQYLLHFYNLILSFDLPTTLRLFRRKVLRFCTRTPGLGLTIGSSRTTFSGSPENSFIRFFL